MAAESLEQRWGHHKHVDFVLVLCFSYPPNPPLTSMKKMGAEQLSPCISWVPILQFLYPQIGK